MENFEEFKAVTFFILQGGVFALKIYVLTLLLGMPLGLLGAIGKLSRFKLLNGFLWAYTWIFRGTPLLLQLFFGYYALPLITFNGLINPIEMSAMMTACVIFVLNYGAYYTEIFRAGIQSIDKGQYEAAKVLGMNYTQTIKSIVLPQSVKIVLPPLGNEAVTLIKDTALVSVIAIPDIMKNATATVMRTGTIDAFVIAAVIYLCMTFIIINVFKFFEKKLSYYR